MFYSPVDSVVVSARKIHSIIATFPSDLYSFEHAEFTAEYGVPILGCVEFFHMHCIMQVRYGKSSRTSVWKVH